MAKGVDWKRVREGVTVELIIKVLGVVGIAAIGYWAEVPWGGIAGTTLGMLGHPLLVPTALVMLMGSITALVVYRGLARLIRRKQDVRVPPVATPLGQDELSVMSAFAEWGHSSRDAQQLRISAGLPPIRFEHAIGSLTQRGFLWAKQVSSVWGEVHLEEAGRSFLIEHDMA